jgi:uncharacterized protein involved in propanediol utilization
MKYQLQLHDNNVGEHLIARHCKSIELMSNTSHFPVGTGVAIGHHGEIIQGAIEHTEKGLRRFIVTLPWSSIQSHAKFVSIRNSEVVIDPSWKTKSKKAAKLTMAYLGINGFGGFLEVYSEIPPKLGLGSSTSDVVAVIRAVSNAFKKPLKPCEISVIAVKAESACDSIMFEDRAVVFCQREGVVMETLFNKLPPAFVLGFKTSDTEDGISTVDFPLPDYDWQELGTFYSLLGALRSAVRTQSIQLLGKVATASARINQRFLPTNKFDVLLDILDEFGACGLQVSHSGIVAGFLFDPDDVKLAKRISETQYALVNLGIKDVWYFNSGWENQ